MVRQIVLVKFLVNISEKIVKTFFAPACNAHCTFMQIYPVKNQNFHEEQGVGGLLNIVTLRVFGQERSLFRN